METSGCAYVSGGRVAEWLTANKRESVMFRRRNWNSYA
jgi:hypothetical protein